MTTFRTIKYAAFRTARKLLGIPDAVQSPKWLHWLFFPIRSFHLSQSQIRYDFISRTFFIYGIEISERVFEDLEYMQRAFPSVTRFVLIREQGRFVNVEKTSDRS